MVHQTRDFLFVLCGVALHLEFVVESHRVFNRGLCFGQVRHAFLDVRKRGVFQGRLLAYLLDEEVFGFADFQ